MTEKTRSALNRWDAGILITSLLFSNAGWGAAEDAAEQMYRGQVTSDGTADGAVEKAYQEQASADGAANIAAEKMRQEQVSADDAAEKMYRGHRSRNGAADAAAEKMFRRQMPSDGLAEVGTATARASETWGSTTLEATSVLGEAYLQSNDPGTAKEKFRDSLGVSTKIKSPQTGIVAMDLYRAGELELREGDYKSARQHLEILVARYPETSWGEAGRRLLALMLGEENEDEMEDDAQAVPDPMQPELLLRQIQTALRNGQDAEALRLAREFEERYPNYPDTDEVRLTEGAVLLRADDAARAVQVLVSLSTRARDPEIQDKARYLLGAADLILGDRQAMQKAVPNVDPKQAPDRWISLAQVWRADSQSRLREVLSQRFSSPASAYADVLLASIEDRDGEVKAAATQMSAAAEESDRWEIQNLGPYARFSLGQLLYKDKEYIAAAQAYGDFVKRYPSDPRVSQVAYQSAMALKWGGRWQDAVNAFSRITELYPSTKEAADAYMQMGQIYSTQGLTAKAIAAYEKMKTAAAAGGDKEAPLLIAQVYYNQKRYQDAIPLYVEFLRDTPNDARAYEVQELLLSSYWLGDRENPGLEAAIESYPKHSIVARIRWEQGTAALKSASYLQAERQFRKIAEDFPQSTYMPGALFYQAESLMKIQDPSAAADIYRKIVEDYSKSPYAQQSSFKLGLALDASGKHTEAAEAYRQVDHDKGKNPLAADALFNEALAMQKAGKKSSALAAYEKFLTRFPSYSRASWVWFQVGKLREGSNLLGPAAEAYAHVRSAQERPQALLSLGRCREKLKERNLASKAYEELRRIHPADDPYRLSGMLRLALIYELKSPRKAYPLYREVLRLSKDENQQGVARRRLNALRNSPA